MTTLYIERDGQPVPAPDIQTWSLWFAAADRRVALDEGPGWRVSTVFMGLDHGYDGRLYVYETMVFGGALDHEQDQYASRAAALAGHAAMVSRAHRWAWTRWIPSPLRRAVLAWSDAR